MKNQKKQMSCEILPSNNDMYCLSTCFNVWVLLYPRRQLVVGHDLSKLQVIILQPRMRYPISYDFAHQTFKLIFSPQNRSFPTRRNNLTACLELEGKERKGNCRGNSLCLVLRFIIFPLCFLSNQTKKSNFPFNLFFSIGSKQTVEY